MQEHQKHPETLSRRSRLRAELRDSVPTLVVLALGLSARSSLADHYHVPSGSMEPTVQVGDRVFVDKRAYGYHVPFTSLPLGPEGQPERGDVVVLESPADGRTLLKRVVALPGDAVAVREGRVILNGARVPIDASGSEQLGEHLHAMRPGGPDFGPTTVPDGQYLVLGDNRGNSFDGRYFGWVERRAIRGKVLAIYYRDGLSWLPL